MESEEHGEGLDHGLAYMVVKAMVEEAKAQRVEIISGRDQDEAWKEISAQALPEMFQKFRQILAKQMTERCKLDTTPPNHVLLALQMHPTINTDVDGDLLMGKSAMQELISLPPDLQTGLGIHLHMSSCSRTYPAYLLRI